MRQIKDTRRVKSLAFCPRQNWAALTSQNDIAFSNIVWVGTTYDKFEVTVTVTNTGIPTGTAADDTESVILRVQIGVGAVV